MVPLTTNDATSDPDPPTKISKQYTEDELNDFIDNKLKEREAKKEIQKLFKLQDGYYMYN